MVGKKSIEVPYSGECEAILAVLEKGGYLAGVKKFKPKGKKYQALALELSYNEYGLPKITAAERVSKPGRRIYKTSDELGSVMSGFGLLIVSTSRGVMSGAEAKKKKLGGEVICKVW